MRAGLRGAVQDGTLDGHAVARRLDDGVLLGVDTAAQLMLLSGGNAELLAQAADVEAMRKPRRSSVVSAGDDALVVNQDGADGAAQAGRTRGDLRVISMKYSSQLGRVSAMTSPLPRFAR